MLRAIQGKSGPGMEGNFKLNSLGWGLNAVFSSPEPKAHG